VLVLYVWFLSSFRRGCGSFLSFHRASCSLWNEATKTWFSAPKIRRDDKGKTAGICREKRKEIRWRVQLQSLVFLIRCGKNPVIYDDPAPLSSFQYPSSNQSLILALFDTVLGPKKNPSNQSRELGQKKSFLLQESLLSH